MLGNGRSDGTPTADPRWRHGSATVTGVDEPVASFAGLLRGMRESRSLTQEELAERAGLTVKAIGALERGERRRPYPHTVRSLADALELDEAERATLVGSVPSRAARAPAPGAPDETPPAPSHPASAPPAPGTATIGRDQEVAALTELVLAPEHRVVTVTGPGGVGKTRLALEVASRLGQTADRSPAASSGSSSPRSVSRRWSCRGSPPRWASRRTGRTAR